MNGIFTKEQAKVEHQTSIKLAQELFHVLPKDQNVIDYGCGKGEYIQYLSERGFVCHGYEGTELGELAVYKDIVRADLTKKMGERPSGSVLCLEVAEHIPKEFEDVLIYNITGRCTGRLILSWALKGQGGCGHVNEQDAAYVIGRIEREGFNFNRRVTAQLRFFGGSDLWWFAKSIYVFDR